MFILEMVMEDVALAQVSLVGKTEFEQQTFGEEVQEDSRPPDWVLGLRPSLPPFAPAKRASLQMKRYKTL